MSNNVFLSNNGYVKQIQQKYAHLKTETSEKWDYAITQIQQQNLTFVRNKNTENRIEIGVLMESNMT